MGLRFNSMFIFMRVLYLRYFRQHHSSSAMCVLCGTVTACITNTCIHTQIVGHSTYMSSLFNCATFETVAFTTNLSFHSYQIQCVQYYIMQLTCLLLEPPNLLCRCTSIYSHTFTHKSYHSYSLPISFTR